MKTRLLIALALIACACTTQERNDYRKYNVTGPVKEIVMQSDSIAMPWTAEFNRSGRLSKVTIFNFDGSESSIITYRYNCRNQLTAVYSAEQEGKKALDRKYKYNGDFARESRTFDRDGQEVYRWVYENDGQHIVRVDFYERNVFQYYGVREYSGESYVNKVYGPDGELNSTIEVDISHHEDKPTRIFSKEDDITIEYDEQGLPVMSRGTAVNSVGDLQDRPDMAAYPCRWYSYEYDEHGNWITRYERKEPDSPKAIVVKRTIIYY